MPQLCSRYVEIVYRRLLPEPAVLADAHEALDGLDLIGSVPAGRPYVVLNMVATVDGRATVAGRTAQISSAPDRQMFHALRTRVDAIMVGAGTIRIERYGRIVRDPELRGRRRALGLAEDPVAVIVSASLGVPPDVPLLQAPEQEVVIVTAGEGELEGCAAQVSYLRASPGVPLSLREMLGRLRAEHGIRTVLCEGGPHLNGSLLTEGLVDELFLSVSPTIAGGAGALSIVMGAELADTVDARLLWLLESGGELFCRYALVGAR
jgi:riboflavin-specific deaminase-like protein